MPHYRTFYLFTGHLKQLCGLEDKHGTYPFASIYRGMGERIGGSKNELWFEKFLLLKRTLDIDKHLFLNKRVRYFQRYLISTLQPFLLEHSGESFVNFELL